MREEGGGFSSEREPADEKWHAERLIPSLRSRRKDEPIKISEPNIDQASSDRVADLIDLGSLSTHSTRENAEHDFLCYLEDCGQDERSLDVNIVSSGTAALHLAMIVYEIGPGDLVFVPNYTFPATVNVVKLVGATPVLVDVEPESYVINAETLSEAIEESRGLGRLRAVIPVHEFGFPAPMTELMEVARANDMVVIEDAACAIGAFSGEDMVGTIGDMGCFSLHPRKIVTTGEGGVVVTRDKQRGRRVARLKNHGMERDEQGEVIFVEPGYNYRLSDIQCALLYGQLIRLCDWLPRRGELAQYYDEQLSPYVERGWFTLPKKTSGQVWQSYVITLGPQFSQREVSAAMREYHIETNCGATVLSTISHLAEQVTPRVEQGGSAHDVIRSDSSLAHV